MTSYQSGNIFALLFGAVGLIGLLAVASMQLITGPLRTTTLITQKNLVQSQLHTNARLVVIHAGTLANNGDADADSFIEPVEYVPNGTADCSISLAGGGCLPNTLGATLTDPYGRAYGYCVWDHGTVDNGHADGAPGAPYRLNGSIDPTKPVIALISGGRDQTFQTSCLAYDGAGTDGVNRVVGSDDLVFTYTYAEAAAASGGLWSIKPTDSETAEIAKDLEVKDSGGNVTFALDRATGIGDFLGITTDVIMPKTASLLAIDGQVSLDADGQPTAGSNDSGAIRITGGSSNYFHIGTGTAGNDRNAWLQSRHSTIPGAFGTIRLNPLGGNVGVGAVTPTTTLHVGGTLRVEGGVPSMNSGTINTSDFAGVNLFLKDSNNRLDIGVSNVGNARTAWLQPRHSTMPGVVGDTELSLSPLGGNVGIGTLTPTSKLDVNGQTKTTGVVISTGPSGTGLYNQRLDLRGDGAAGTGSYLNFQDNRLSVNNIGNGGVQLRTSAGAALVADNLGNVDVLRGVRFGNDPASCTLAKAGTMRFTGGNPAWSYCDGTTWVPFQAEASGGGGENLIVVDKSGSFSIASNEANHLFLVDTTATATLPALSSVPSGFRVYVKRTSMFGTVTVAAAGADTIEGTANRTIDFLGGVMELVSTPSQWELLRSTGGGGTSSDCAESGVIAFTTVGESSFAVTQNMVDHCQIVVTVRGAGGGRGDNSPETVGGDGGGISFTYVPTSTGSLGLFVGGGGLSTGGGGFGGGGSACNTEETGAGGGGGASAVRFNTTVLAVAGGGGGGGGQNYVVPGGQGGSSGSGSAGSGTGGGYPGSNGNGGLGGNSSDNAERGGSGGSGLTGQNGYNGGADCPGPGGQGNVDFLIGGGGGGSGASTTYNGGGGGAGYGGGGGGSGDVAPALGGGGGGGGFINASAVVSFYAIPGGKGGFGTSSISTDRHGEDGSITLRVVSR